jgi:hypothetical protein
MAGFGESVGLIFIGAAVGWMGAAGTALIRERWLRGQAWREAVVCTRCKRHVPRYFMMDRDTGRGPPTWYAVRDVCRQCRDRNHVLWPHPAQGERERDYDGRTLGVWEELKSAKRRGAEVERATLARLAAEGTDTPSPSAPPNVPPAPSG